MPDFGTPVAAGVNSDPTRGLKTISELMGLQQQGLTIQQQQQNLQKGAAATQVEQQVAAQRKAIAGVDWSKYDDGTGTVSTDKMLSDQSLRQAAGDQFLDVIKAGAAVRGQQIQNKQSIVGLNDKLRGQFGDMVGALRTDPDVIADNPTGRQKVATAMQQFGEVGGPDAQKVAGISGQVVNHAPQGQLARGVNSIQLQAMDASQQAAAQQPRYQDVGERLTNINPNAAGGNLTATPDLNKGVAPERLAGINPLTGQPFGVVYGGAKGGQGAASGGQQANAAPAANTSSEWPKMPAFPSPQQGAAATAGAAKADAVRAADSHPVSGYEPTRQVYQNLLSLVEKNPAIGPKSGAWNAVTGVLTPLGASPNSSMQEVESYLDRLALQNSSAAGLSTDAARHMSQTAAGTTEMNPTALKEKLRFGAATLEASHAYRQGLDKVIGTDNRNPIATSAFDSAWTKNADITAFRLLAAKKNGDKEGYDSTLAQIHSMTPSQRATVEQHMRNLNLLSNGHMPPQ